MRGKNGLSPVVATTLLVGIVVVLGVIIFFWARSVLPELIQKDGVNIEQFCDDVNFDVDASISGQNLSLTIVNRGTVPIFSFAVRKVGGGGSENLGSASFSDTLGLSAGQTAKATLKNQAGVGSSSTLFIAPILLGETDEAKRPHACDDEYGKDVVIA